MIRYNPKDWLTFIFRFHKADTFRKLLPLILVICAYSGAIAYLEQDVWKLDSTSHIKNLSLIHTTLGLVISLLLVFRTNTAYERWWEGRKIWGSLVNSSRNLAMKVSVLMPEENMYFAAMIPNFALSLKNHLRDAHDAFELKKTDDFNPDNYHHQSHVPNRIAQKIIAKIIQHQKLGTISAEHLIYLQADLDNFTNSTGACERIRKTPIPFSYSVFLKKFIFIYVMTLPFAYVFLLGYWVIPVVAIIFYVLASLELIAEEIEDPFGNDANDLPVDSICGAIHHSVIDIFKEAN
jgi:ion channel-forming bestrophin family protein